MRRIAVLVCALACLAAPAAASAAITPTSDAGDLAATLGGGGNVTGAAFTEIPGLGAPHGTSDTAIGGFPPNEGGAFAILTTGDATLAERTVPAPTGGDGTDLGTGPAHGLDGAPGNAYDSSILQVNVTVPEGATCLSFDYRFLSEEWEENVGQNVNDGFLAFLDAPAGTTDPNGDIAAPANFARDADGDVISINTATMTAENAAGTTYDGATPLLTASTPVTPGAHQLYLAIFDQGDPDFDSAVFLDNLAFSDLNGSECVGPGNVDDAAPEVTITAPADGATTTDAPLFGGQAGNAATDSTHVTVQVYQAGSATLVDVVNGERAEDGSWRAAGEGLTPGDYVARAHQVDSAGNVGVSESRAFTVGGVDTIPPSVRILSPASGASTSDATPTLSGTAGAADGDSPEVEVDLYAGPSASGEPVQLQLSTRSGTAWSVDADALEAGNYTAVASQTDASDNVGTSPPVTFTITSSQPPGPTPEPPVEPTPEPPVVEPPPPEPVQGQSFVAGPVSGTVKVRLRNGKFRTLGANESIPLGSTVDATKGRVRLTSAAGAGGRVQTADFYQGQFLVTQTKGAKPITQLTLNAPLACGKGKASAAAKKKKVRSLWGDGKGRFRTKGRHGAATVRGTMWNTKDTCTTTTFKVKRGVVSVRDFVKRKTVTVKKGHSYVVRKKKRK